MMAKASEGGGWTVGLMSGTSMDGIDAALLRTDGERVLETGKTLSTPYTAEFRERLRAILGFDHRTEVVDAVEREITLLHAEAVRRLLESADLPPGAVDLIGFHGQTIFHAPERRFTWQLGDGALLARECGIPVACDFRSDDVAAGGEGAPLAPAYHAALAADLPRPLAVLNLGGVGNVTYMRRDEGLLAFDTGPANALIDDQMLTRTGERMDVDGRLAAEGQVDEGVLARLMDNPYFTRKPPKSLDRDAFDAAPVRMLSLPDAVTTLVAFTVRSVERALAHMPENPQRWLVCGGGRHNPVIMAMLADRLAVPVESVEAVGWDGDMLEAQAFAFLARRCQQSLPLTYPGTTNVPAPQTGGRIVMP